MSAAGVRDVSRILGIAPQFLVDDLDRATSYYCEKLGFELDFEYDGFYASVKRDGFAIHLKEAPKVAADREHRMRNEHLDAYIAVSNNRSLFSELNLRGAHLILSLEERPWGCLEFYVQDPDGYIICFSERV